MGTGRDKRKKAKGSSVAGQGAGKTEKKTQANAEKQNRRDAKGFIGGEDDIDAILAQLGKEQAVKSSVTVTNDAPAPSPRVNGVFLAMGDQKMEEVIMFGGEMLDAKTDKLYMYSDLYKYNVNKDRWTHIKSPGPQPRSACCSAIHKGFLYIFGGEFTSINQEKFKHYRDLWRLDLSTWEWDELKSKKGPSARSGHRMVNYKGKLIMFGGYFDNNEEQPKYYKDMWQYDVDTLTWSPIGNMKDKWPTARSGFQFALAGERLLMHGGYSKKKSDDEDDMEHGVAYEDTWCWHIEKQKWERIPKAGMAPSKRASFSLAVHKDRAILFGGVADEEAKAGEVIVSNFFNELYQLNMTQMRWFPVVMRSNKKSAEETAASNARLGQQTIEAPDTDPLDAAKNAAALRIQAHYRGHVVRKAFKLYKIGGTVSEVLYSPAAYGVDLSSRNAPKPRARINAGMAVCKNQLVLFGGIVEIGDQEMTLDDMWKLDLSKLDGWTCVKDNTAGADDFVAKASKDSDSDWETDDDDDDNDDLANMPKMSMSKATIK